ncbi:DUF3341 domain-containing protein [Vulgatibacter incomptus]|uniref:ABC-type Fe3+ transport system protein n=1 Tax=Vulgatibacter incomptus TaxID=1391653 RepID=A0A0K1PH28_9BACT|nr:DUF3341 domain-containing protein [Vulgatibacter incomptus]AKU92812.1 ABC-type Fe3+ transport system protein [Vulgatibacter incomptus]
MAKHKVLVAEFDTPAEIVSAAGKLQAAGYRDYDAHIPFPIHGLDKAMKIPDSKLGWIVLACGITGASIGLGLQWWSSTIEYPMVIGGKPFFSFQAFVPVTFALTILLSAFGTVFGMFALNGLPRWHHPVLMHPNLRRMTDDKFYLSVESDDPRFDLTKTRDLLEQVGGKRIALLETP